MGCRIIKIDAFITEEDGEKFRRATIILEGKQAEVKLVATSKYAKQSLKHIHVSDELRVIGERALVEIRGLDEKKYLIQ